MKRAYELDKKTKRNRQLAREAGLCAVFDECYEGARLRDENLDMYEACCELYPEECWYRKNFKLQRK